MNALLRLYEINKGKIDFLGKSTEDYNLSKLR